jgi:hypothetical protein
MHGQNMRIELLWEKSVAFIYVIVAKQEQKRKCFKKTLTSVMKIKIDWDTVEIAESNSVY